MNQLQQFYAGKFYQQEFVVKLGGDVLQDKAILKSILEDVQTLHEAGIRIILVHGGGPQADTMSKKLDHIPQKINGRRVTTETDLEIVKMLYGGSLNLEILSILKTLDISGIRVSGLDGNLLDVIKRPTHNGDFGFVGDITQVNPQILHDLAACNYLPVVSPIAADSEGTILNINADTIATELAIALKAAKLILFTNVDGVQCNGEHVSYLTPEKGQQFIDDEVVTGGMRVKLETCMQAADSGVERVHILNGLHPHSLLGEVFSKEGVGTMITSETEQKHYESGDLLLAMDQ